MMEFAIVLFIEQRYSDENLYSLQRPILKNQIIVKEMEMPQTSKISTNSKAPSGFKKSYSFSQKIDFIALFVFALSYFIFNCVYFEYYRPN
jgi:hypothetical protein